MTGETIRILVSAAAFIAYLYAITKLSRRLER